jgi:methionyl aminopeptidase
MTIETDDQLQALKHIGHIVAFVLREMMKRTEPGMTTLELDQIGASLLDQHGAESAPKVMYEFPGFTCISINEEAAHGVPGSRIIQPGDMVNIDVSARKDGYFADTGGSFIVPPADYQKTKLIESTRLALADACRATGHGRKLNQIGKAVQKVARKKGFKIIKNLCSHGVGRSLHEEPKEIPGYFDPHDTRVLKSGQVITIEPFLSTRSQFAKEAADGWTLVTEQGNLSAQFEHTMVITHGMPILLTI